MAVVSATSLKSSMGTAETALDTLIATPSVTNLNAAVAALDTCVTNARDSRTISATDAKGRIHHEFLVSARALRQELQNSAAHHASSSQPVGPASIYRSIKRTYLSDGTPWRTYRQTATTD